jgi:hypothetical protein
MLLITMNYFSYNQLTNATEQNPSWEANSHSAIQWIPAFYVKFKVVPAL